MTHIEQMIQDMCPNGVEWKTFDELGVFYGGLSGKTKEDFKDGNAKFITYLNIANNPALRLDIEETVKIGPNEKQNIVQYGDALFTGSSETPDECAMSSVVTEQPTEDLYLNSFCFGFRFNRLDGICPAFYKHYFRSDHFRKAVRRTANGTTRFNVSKKEFAKLEIPIPPLEIQEKIVRILDSFSALAAELQAELQARRKQYEYYRTRLLTPSPSESNSADNSTDDANGWQWKTLGEVCDMKAGVHINAEDINEEAEAEYIYPCFGGNGIRGYVKDFSHIGEFPIIGRQGALCGCVNYAQDKFYATEHAVVVKPNQGYNSRYLFHMLTFADLNQYKSQGAQPGLAVGNLKMLKYAFPPLAEQKRIADLLDKFEALTTSLSDGIPAEQAMQQKRYEYYRDLLLNFEKRP